MCSDSVSRCEKELVQCESLGRGPETDYTEMTSRLIFVRSDHDAVESVPRGKANASAFIASELQPDYRLVTNLVIGATMTKMITDEQDNALPTRRVDAWKPYFADLRLVHPQWCMSDVRVEQGILSKRMVVAFLFSAIENAKVLLVRVNKLLSPQR